METLMSTHTAFQVCCSKRNNEGGNQAWWKETNIGFAVGMYVGWNLALLIPYLEHTTLRLRDLVSLSEK